MKKLSNFIILVLIMIILLSSFSVVSAASVKFDIQKTTEIKNYDRFQTTAQGFCKVTISGKTCYLAAVIKNSTWQKIFFLMNRNNSNAYIYILDENGNIQAVITNWVLGHVNSMAHDSKNGKIFVTYEAGKLLAINENAITDAIATAQKKSDKRVNLKKSKYVSEVKITNSQATIGSLDYANGTLYGTNKENLYKITFEKDKKTATFTRIKGAMQSAQNINDNGKKYISWGNAGLSIFTKKIKNEKGKEETKKYMALARYSVDDKNGAILIFQFINNDSDIKFIGSYNLKNTKDSEKHEIEGIEYLENNTFAIYYNNYGTSKKNLMEKVKITF